MIIDDKEEFYKCLEKLGIPKVVKKEIERIVLRMNNNEEIYYEFFDRKTDDEMLRRGRIKRAEKKAKKLGYEEGRTEGHTEGMMSILRNMKQTGMKISEISKVTLIPESQIQKLLK